MVNKLIQAMIMMVIGLALLPVVTEFANDLTGAEGALEDDATLSALVDLLPVLYVIILVAGSVTFVVTRTRGVR